MATDSGKDSTDKAPLAHAELIDCKALSPSSFDLTLFVSEKLCYFAGHFPSFPILPGVVQVDWAVAFARDYLAMQSPVTQVERLKFTHPIQPNKRVLLSLALSADNSCVNFRFHAPDLQPPVTYSQGRLVYGQAPL